MLRTRDLLTPAIALAFAIPAAARIDDTDPGDRRGMASAWPVAVIVKDTSGPSPSYSIRIRPPGDLEGPGGPPLAPDHTDGSPVYRLSTMFPSLSGDIDIDGISSGNAFLNQPITNGSPNIVNRWLAVTASVSSASTTPNSALFEYDSPDPGSSLVSFYYEKSTSLASDMAGQTELESTGSAMGFGANPNAEVVGVDYGIGVHEFSPTGVTPLLFPLKGEFFFSVTRDWAANSAPANFATYPGGAPFERDISGADILRMSWNTDTESWDGPYVFATAETLGFQIVLDVDGETILVDGEVDAFDVDVGLGSGVPNWSRMNIVYSPAKETWSLLQPQTGNVSQLMILDGVEDTAPGREETLVPASGAGPVRLQSDPIPPTSGPTPTRNVPPKIGLTDIGSGDELDGVCSWDPYKDPSGAGGDQTISLLTRVDLIAAAGIPFGLSGVRLENEGDVSHDSMHFQFTGWGTFTPENAFIDVYARFGEATTNLNDYTFIGGTRRFADRETSEWQWDFLPAWTGTLDSRVSFVAVMRPYPGSPQRAVLSHFTECWR